MLLFSVLIFMTSDSHLAVGTKPSPFNWEWGRRRPMLLHRFLNAI